MQAFKVCCGTLKIWMIQLALVLSIQAQDCSRPTGGPNMVLSDSFINRDTFTNGEQVSFVCSTGYVSAGGSRLITCTDGVWSEVKMECKIRSCGSPGEILNGHFEFPDGIEFGAIVHTKCDVGYNLVGSGDRTCTSQGWSGRVPICEAVMCGPPPEILNGGPVTPPEEEYKYGDVVVYTCQKEFTMNGSSSISCSENGEFQPSPPTCIKVSCPTPVVENGFRVEGGSPPYKHRSYVKYSCNSGYKMNGQASLTCEMNGWSADFPSCIAIPATPKSPTTTTKPTTTTSTKTPPSATTPSTTKDGKAGTVPPQPENNTGKIVGGVFGVFCVLIVIGFIIYKCKKRSRGGYSGNVATKTSEDREL